MDWRSYLLNAFQLTDKEVTFAFSGAANEHSVAKLKSEFQLLSLPNELEELYHQCNGIEQLLNDERIGHLVWPIEKVVEVNNEYRNSKEFKDLYISFEQLLFFSDAGNGDLFCFVETNRKFEKSDIFVWNHEDDSKNWVAPSLEKFLEWWINGKITV